MRLLYVAPDQVVPGTLGGSVHVQAVAEGLADLGHEIHVATSPGAAWPRGAVHWHAMSPPLGQPVLRWARAAAVASLAREIRAEAIMERYYNFAGEGVLAARRLRIPAILEVNAPVVDYPGSPKALVDRALIVEPMRRWRERICRLTDLFITPSAEMLPAWVDPARVLRVEWGADTRHFRPRADAARLRQGSGAASDRQGSGAARLRQGSGAASEAAPFPKDPARVWCVFAGAFRSWHGVAHLTSALARLHAAGDHRFGAVLLGDGPERPAAERAARDVPGIFFTGAIPHDQLPRYLAAADIGVAPFDAMRHRPLRLGFYWSPLKVFEYMACGLPVVAPRLPRLTTLVEHGREGWLYDPEAPRALDGALTALADAPTRQRLGAAARERAVRDFSWAAHCRALDARLRELLRTR